ncbi:MAG: hypothetical protein Q9194_003855 [Teloschistes cf. exilis]
MPDNPKPCIAYYVCDITDQAQTEEVMSKIKPAALIHTAGVGPRWGERYSRNHQERFFSINVEGTRNLISAAKSSNDKAFVWTGSCCAVTDDLSRQFPNIDERQAAAETLVLAASSVDMPTCSLRPPIIFGPRDPAIIPSLHACIANKETSFIIGDGLNMWDLTYLSNVADAHVLALENLLSTRTAAGQAIIIINEQPLPFRDFCLGVWKEFGHFPPSEIRIPASLAGFTGYVKDWTTWLLDGPPSVLSQGSVKDACQIRYCSGAKARDILGYRPRIGIEEGIRISCRQLSRLVQKMPTNNTTTMELNPVVDTSPDQLEDAYSSFSTRSKRWIAVAASIGATFSGLSSFIYYSALTPLATDLHTSIQLINLTITSYLIVSGIVPSIIGDLADRTGRRPLYLMAFTVYFAANVGLALQNSYTALLVLRMVQSAGSSSKFVGKDLSGACQARGTYLLMRVSFGKGTITLAYGVMADIAPPAERGSYVGMLLGL